MLALSLGFGASLAASLGSAADALLIGGGYELHASQGQIEKNVIWVRNILERQGLDTRVWFTDGHAPGDDVHYLLAASDVSITPLARVFGEQHLDRLRFRGHAIDGVSGTTEAPLLVRALEAHFDSKDDVPTTLIYNGHGDQSPDTPDGVTINLWNDTSLGVADLDRLIGNRGAPFRYLFTQCYSGGFHRLMYKDPADPQSGVDGMRCGFTAESAYQLAEGCSASVESDDYRDYTTFFFAAIGDRARDDTVLLVNPDTNEDGLVGLREAHFYALGEALSSDIPLASSEQYLDDWQPWYLRWLPATTTALDSDYARLARHLATRLDLPEGPGEAKLVRDRLAAAAATYDELAEQQQELIDREAALQGQLQQRLFHRWPSLAGPYTGAFAALAERGSLAEVNRWLNTQGELAELADVQIDIEKLDFRLLDIEREEVQYRKIIHLRRLARLEAQLMRFGSDAERADYRSLVDCESLPLDGGSAGVASAR